MDSKCSHMYSYKREAWDNRYRRENTARRRGDATTEAEKRRNSGIYPELDKTGRHSPKSLWREHSPTNVLILTQSVRLKRFGLQKAERINFCSCKPPRLCWLVVGVLGS